MRGTEFQDSELSLEVSALGIATSEARAREADLRVYCKQLEDQVNLELGYKRTAVKGAELLRAEIAKLKSEHETRLAAFEEYKRVRDTELAKAKQDCEDELGRLKELLAGTPAAHVEAVFQLAKQNGFSEFCSEPPTEFLRRQLAQAKKDRERYRAYEQWYSVKHLLPLNRAEGGEHEFVLCAWVDKSENVTSMRTCRCDNDGVFYLAGFDKPRTQPHYWRELPWHQFEDTARAEKEGSS